MPQEDSLHSDHVDSFEYQKGLDTVTRFALEKNFDAISAILDMSKKVLVLSVECVGEDSLRKGAVIVDGNKQQITHFAHMVRVAFMAKYFFPEDQYSRILGALHDTKEEALPEKEMKYKDAENELGLSRMSQDIELLTEENPTVQEIEEVQKSIPEGFDASYIAKYRSYIKKLHDNWQQIGNMELCDRLDGSNFEYLKDPKYHDRIKQKALESFGRIYATISISSHPLVQKIKNACREQMPQFDVKESEIQEAAKYFLE